ncbi:MAG: hypothetical protein ACYCWW_14705 [Deltaproteobacteria bacterium]
MKILLPFALLPLALALAACGPLSNRASLSPGAGGPASLPGGKTAGPRATTGSATTGGATTFGGTSGGAGTSGAASPTGPSGGSSGSAGGSGGPSGGGSTGSTGGGGQSSGGAAGLDGGSPGGLPGSAPPPVIVTLSSEAQTLACLPTAGTDDGPGTLAVGELPSAGKGTVWKFWSIETGVLLNLATEDSVDLPLVWSQPSGFTGLSLDAASGTQLLRSYSHEGALVSSVLVQSDPASSAAGAPVSSGGTVLLRGLFDGSGCSIRFARYDVTGATLGSEQTVETGLPAAAGTLRCPAPPFWVDLEGDTLVFVAPAGKVRARWLGPTGAPQGPWFAAPAIPSAMAALSDGSLASKEPTPGGPSLWLRRYPDGAVVPAALPGWIASRQPVAVYPIHGGQGYLATFPEPSESEIFSADGTSCGPAGIPAAVIGRDGSAMRQDGRCVYNWWPGLFP